MQGVVNALEFVNAFFIPITAKLNQLLSGVIKLPVEQETLLESIPAVSGLVEGESVSLSLKRVVNRSLVVCFIYFLIFSLFALIAIILLDIITFIFSTLFFLLVWCPTFLLFVLALLSEFTQKKVIITNKRIIKQIGPGRDISIWFTHVERFDKVSFPDRSGMLYYTIIRTVFNKDLKIRYKVENLAEVNEAYALVSQPPSNV